MLSGWVERLGADRLYAWTSISAPPPCSTVQLGDWAHYRSTLAHTHTHAHAHAHRYLPHTLSFHLSLSLLPSFFSFFSCQIVTFSPLTLLFLSFFVFLFLCHILFTHTQHILPFFFCFFATHSSISNAPFFFSHIAFFFFFTLPASVHSSFTIFSHHLSFSNSLSLSLTPSPLSLSKSQGTRGRDRDSEK